MKEFTVKDTCLIHIEEGAVYLSFPVGDKGLHMGIVIELPKSRTDMMLSEVAQSVDLAARIHAEPETIQ